MNIIEFWRSEWTRVPELGNYAEKEVAEFVSKLLRLSGKERLLDVGCGTGLLLVNLKATEKYGLDYSEGSVRKAREKNPGARIVWGEAAKLPFADQFFDRVLSHSTFLYYDCDYAAKALHEMERVCRKEGVIVVGDVPDAGRYFGGSLGYSLRTAALNLVGKPHYTRYEKAFFEKRGYAIADSPFNERFYAYKTKE